MKCKICNREISEKGIFRHIKDTHKMDPKEYYDKYLKKEGEDVCPICGKKTRFLGIISGYGKTCSRQCASKYALSVTKEKYGVDNISQIPQVKQKMSNSIKESWNSLSAEEYEERCKNISSKTKENSHKFVQSKKEKRVKFENDNNCVQERRLIEKYGCGWLFANIIPKEDKLFYNGVYFIRESDLKKIEDYEPDYSVHSSSNKEKELFNYIESVYSGTIIKNTRKIISPQELDIYIPDKNLAIEFNGTYWHSDKVKPKNYHLEKSKLCEEKGIRLIHIYEWELEEPHRTKIKMMLNQALGSNPTIYARNCEIKEISNKEAKILNEKVHLQGHRNAQVTYGLFYEDELVQLMSFSKTRYNRNLKGENDWEIIRGCPGSNISVVGGVSKLFKHFVREHNPDKVFSYCDFNKFDGKSYEALGMRFIGYTGPDKTWIIDGEPVKRNPKRYKELKEKSDGIMWGSGSKKYEWK